jgi:hypothetical protein
MAEVRIAGSNPAAPTVFRTLVAPIGNETCHDRAQLTRRNRLRATGATVIVDGHNLTLITAGLSSITLITGFVVFAAVRRSLPFDRRLGLAGYRPAALIAAKTSAAVVQAVAIDAYAAIIMLFFWRPPDVWAVALTFMLAAATYAALGLLIGVLVRGDLEGFFLIIMIALLDTFLENPVDNPLANKPLLEFFRRMARRSSLPRGFSPPGTREHGRGVAGLDGCLRPARAGRPAHAHAPARPCDSRGQSPAARRRCITFIGCHLCRPGSPRCRSLSPVTYPHLTR